MKNKRVCTLLCMGLTLAGGLSALPVSAAQARNQARYKVRYQVSNFNELVQALGPNREIRLSPGIYQLEPGFKPSPYVKWRSPDNHTLVVQNVKNLSITGSGREQTKLVSASCAGEILDFESSTAVHLQGVGFGRRLPGKTQELDCSPDLREQIEAAAMPAFKPDPAKIDNWQRVAHAIANHKSQGLQLPDFTQALYPQLLEQVKAQTAPIQPEQDPIRQRSHSLRPRLGENYQLSGKLILNQNRQPAQAAAMIFDRDQNLLAVMDAQAQVILAVEGRNNTRQSWVHTPEWLMQHSMVLNSNAPAPNGVYAFGTMIRDNPQASFSFGSFRIVLEGGKLTEREILFHSRDHKLNQEIPWSQDLNDENIRTLGCFLFQDPDLNLLAQLLLDANRPVALVVQGGYAKNISSPAL